MFKLQDEVLYCGRRVYIVGVRQPTRYETERHYDIASKPGTSKPNQRNVAEKHLRYPAPALQGCPILEFA